MKFSIMNVNTGKYLKDPADPTKKLVGSLVFIRTIHDSLTGLAVCDKLVEYTTALLAHDADISHYVIVELAS